MTKGRDSRRYREIFFANYGVGPFDCFGCQLKVTFEDVTIHHLDLNHDNNVVENFAPMHSKCHTRYHANLRRGKKRGPNARFWLHKQTPEQLEANRVAHLGLKHSDETKKKIADAHRGKVHSLEHIEKNRLGHLGSKRSLETRQRMSDAAKLRWERQRARFEQ
jgi:hypothetical protein